MTTVPPRTSSRGRVGPAGAEEAEGVAGAGSEDAGTAEAVGGAEEETKNACALTSTSQRQSESSEPFLRQVKWYFLCLSKTINYIHMRLIDILNCSPYPLIYFTSSF